MYRLYIVLWVFSGSFQLTHYPYNHIEGRLDLGNIEVYRGCTPLLLWHIDPIERIPAHLVRTAFQIGNARSKQGIYRRFRSSKPLPTLRISNLVKFENSRLLYLARTSLTVWKSNYARPICQQV